MRTYEFHPEAEGYLNNYLIAYAPNKKPLWILAVMHGRRSPRVIASILKGRE
jgi:hypothetical protein